MTAQGMEGNASPPLCACRSGSVSADSLHQLRFLLAERQSLDQGVLVADAAPLCHRLVRNQGRAGLEAAEGDRVQYTITRDEQQVGTPSALPAHGCRGAALHQQTLPQVQRPPPRDAQGLLRQPLACPCIVSF